MVLVGEFVQEEFRIEEASVETPELAPVKEKAVIAGGVLYLSCPLVVEDEDEREEASEVVVVVLACGVRPITLAIIFPIPTDVLLAARGLLSLTTSEVGHANEVTLPEGIFTTTAFGAAVTT